MRIDGLQFASLPIPASFSTDRYIGDTPNHAAALLMADGRTIYQTQPFYRASNSSHATSGIVFPHGNIFGDGIAGAHGGSGLSALGGTIRLNELVPDGVIRHALKIVLDQRFLAFRHDDTPGYRWPALKADGHASSWTYQGSVPALEMGALLALKPTFSLNQLATEPGRIIAQALIDYGAYLCDVGAWDAFYLATEWSPEGRVKDEFESQWGYPMHQPDRSHPWSQDIARIVRSLHVVDSNSPIRPGGGGKPRVPLAPPFKESSF